MAHSEHARQWVHVGSGLFALLLRVLTWWQAAALAATALTFNLIVLPRIGGRRFYRPAGGTRGLSPGLPPYSPSGLFLLPLFPLSLPNLPAPGGVPPGGGRLPPPLGP